MTPTHSSLNNSFVSPSEHKSRKRIFITHCNQPDSMKYTNTFSWLLILLLIVHQSNSNPTVCIIGSGIGGSSVAHFLRRYSSTPKKILIFERNSIVGGRIESTNISGETVELGASFLAGSNLYVINYTEYLDLKRVPAKLEGFGTWDGKKIVVETHERMADSKMTSFVEETRRKFSKLYEEERPVFESVDEMLKWAGLFDFTFTTLDDLMTRANLSRYFIRHIAPAMSRFSYLEDASSISGFAGIFSLLVMSDNLGAVEGGNWQMASGLINRSDVELHLQEEITSISRLGNYYELNSTKGDSYRCQVAVVATPLDEQYVQFSPGISIPERKMQHLDITVVRGLINSAYFGVKEPSDFPAMLGTIVEDPDVAFVSMYIHSKHSAKDFTYKIFSKQLMTDALLDRMFRKRKHTVRVGWSAVPYYKAPEVFAPYVLDGHHLYYVNAIENAASAMEMSAISAENVARLIVSKFFGTLTSNASSAAEGSFLLE